MVQSLQQSTVPALYFTPKRESGLQRLTSFIPKAVDYAHSRNFIETGYRNVSRLSPYLRYRLISEKEVASAVLRDNPSSHVRKFIDELGWRTYFKGHLELHPGIWEAFARDRKALRDNLDRHQDERLRSAESGQTGIDCFDYWTSELIETGYLHNHVRMWYASIWIFTLRLPWELGADFFLRHLYDGDPASNTLGWRWVAGLHTRGKHYLARAENIRRYTNGQFNPVGLLNEEAEAITEPGAFNEQGLSPVTRKSELDEPCLSCCPAGLLVLPDDLSPETSELGDSPFNSICCLYPEDVYRNFGLSEKVRSFAAEATADCSKRIANHWSGRVVTHTGELRQRLPVPLASNVGTNDALRVHAGTVHNWTEAVLHWVREENLNSVWMLQPPAGPLRDALPPLKAGLRRMGVKLFECRRRWDSLHWPHARGGFFRFKELFNERIESLNFTE
jgi:deoxyribodipyrimidine photo-lyase